MLCGESLCSETATFLKVGATALVVALADAGLAPGSGVQLADPLAALQSVAGDVTCKKPLHRRREELTAIAIQRHYLEQAEAQWATEFCRVGGGGLPPLARGARRLEDAPGSVGQTLDWGIKRALYTDHARSLGIGWSHLPFLNQVLDQFVPALCAENGRGNALSLETAIATAKRMPRRLAGIQPLLRAHGVRWEDLRTLLNCRGQFFEIDTRFGQLGPKGIFHTLDQPAC